MQTPPHPWEGSGDPTNDLPGTLHDFSATADPDPNVWGTPLVNEPDEGCLACHDGPDWNHAKSTANKYTVSDTTNYVKVGQPNQLVAPHMIGPESGLCLDCHDSTVDLGDFPGSADPDAVMPESGNFGLDLRHHHPVSFDYPDDAMDWYNLNPSTGGTGSNSRGDPSGLLFGPDKITIECATCHDQHTHYQENNPVDVQSHGSYRWGHFVRMRSICFFCHPRYQDDVGPGRNPGLGKDGVIKTTANGHHLPGRNDPFGIKAGTQEGKYTSDWEDHNQNFACIMCHDINGEGTWGHGHNSACTKCHTRWVPDPKTSQAPTDPSSKGHHGLPDRGDPYGLGECHLCHANPVTGQLTGTSFGDIDTPGCGECHTDYWSKPIPIEVTYDGDAEGTTGEGVMLSASIVVPGTNSAYTDDITYQWIFGDGSLPPVPVTVKSNGVVAVTHTYLAEGAYTGYLSVTANGTNGPIVEEFEIVVTDPPDPDEVDAWVVTEDVDSDTVPDDPDDVVFDVTFESAPGGSGDVLSIEKVLDGVSSLGIGTKMGGVIFWIDIEFSLENWGVGNTYFANIGGGEMVGVVITPTGGFHNFTAEEK